jgi:integrase
MGIPPGVPVKAAKSIGPCPSVLSRGLSKHTTASTPSGGMPGRAGGVAPGGRGRKQLTGDRMTRQDARRMIIRRAKKAGLLTRLGCHSFRATGITVYLLNGGLLEYAQQMAAHESARTTKLYDRRNDQVTLDQVERIVL